MTKTLTCLTAAAALALVAGAAHAEPLKVAFGAEPYPPFTYKAASGEWAGFEIDFAEALCAEMGVECEQAPVAWSGIIPALTSGKVDLILGSMSITEERDQVIDFSIPYYLSVGAFVAPLETELSSLEDLDGLILGVQGATIHASYAQEVIAETVSVDIQYYDQQEQANRDLLAGRIDAILADDIAMSTFAGRDDAASVEVKFAADPHPIFGEGAGVGMREDEPELQAMVNAGLTALIENGTCRELSMQYFGTNICAE